MTARLEHANLLVRDIGATVRFLQTAFPEFRIRFDARKPDGTGWVHVGTDDTYIALAQSTIEPEKRWQPYRKRIYFFDGDGNDWEFIQYLTDDLAKRHDYTIPDI